MSAAGYVFKFDFIADIKALQDSFKKINQDIGGVQDHVKGIKSPLNDVKNPLESLTGLFAGVGVAAAAAFAVDKIFVFGQESIGVLKEVQQNTELLKMKLGEFRTPKILGDLENFADKMGMSIPSVQDTFVNLVNRGFEPTMEQMRQLSDFAVISKKPIDQLMEALLDSEMNENERLKEFGVNMKVNGKTIMATYNGITKSINNNKESVRDYLLGLGNEKGIKGASEKLGGTLKAKQQKSENAEYSAKTSFGQILEPFESLRLDMMTGIFKGLKEVFDGIRVVTEPIGAFIKKAVDWTIEFVKPSKEMVAMFGSFLEVWKSGFQVLKEKITAASGGLGKFGEMWLRLRDKYRDAFVKIGTALLPITQTIGKLVFWLSGKIWEEVLKDLEFIADSWLLIFDVYDKVYNKLKSLFETLSVGVNDIYTTIGDRFAEAGTWITDMFPKFVETFLSIKDWLNENFFKPLGLAFDEILGKNNDKMSLSEDNFRSEQGGKDEYKKIGINDRMKGGSANGVSGGTNIKHITINITKLIETQILQAGATFNETKANVKDAVIEVLMSAVNDANYSAG